ncbi:type II secretion system F family protein [Blastococcus sp. TF02A_35]|uniref:type II secretion system F family protein n=1 Tax=Blastococcus sp. TF02A-35 TaxID=2559612 RepID=UPI001074149D|nr:type II secretion system F family protein [Blastococcus sp. TF02A_35]TFV48544.1 pilus assembly protein TadB [Blastococcus sp. TF02A_35]
MTAALLAVAGALLLWPHGRVVLRHRLRRVAPGPAGRRELRPLPLPALAAVLAGGAAAVLSTILVAVLAAGCAAVAARGWQARRREAAGTARLGTLGELLAALAAELRAGRSLEEALRGAVADCPDRACADALVRAVRAPGAGPPGRVAGAEGVPAALDRLSAAVVLSARTGCSLSAVVSAVEDDLRDRQRRRRELLVATAGPRASARLLAGLPLLGLAMGSGVGADPWHVLTRTGTGQVLLVAGVLLEAAGIAWTGRLVRRTGP